MSLNLMRSPISKRSTYHPSCYLQWHSSFVQVSFLTVPPLPPDLAHYMPLCSLSLNHSRATHIFVDVICDSQFVFHRLKWSLFRNVCFDRSFFLIHGTIRVPSQINELKKLSSYVELGIFFMVMLH